MKADAPKITDNLNTWLDYWSHVHVTGIDLGLDRVIPVAQALGVTQPQAKVFTVAGTNGKGSTTTILAEILKAQGYKVGLYQSPHIYHFNERVKYNAQPVDDQTLINAFVKVDQARRQCNLSLSFFEATTLAAFLIFKDLQCDVWVLEVGLGGRLDVVNVIDPNVAVITNIGLDHTDWLGDTVEKIAFEKAGIIRPNIPVVFGSDQVLPQAIAEKVKETQAKLCVAGQDYFYQTLPNSEQWMLATAGTTLQLPLGQLALENTATAVTAALVSGLNISHAALAKGIQSAQLAGRFEQRQIANKTVIFDAGHNAHGVEFLLKQLRNYLKYHKQYTQVVAVFSMLADKDIKSVVELLKPAVFEWKIASLDVPRAAPVAQIEEALQGESVQTLRSVQDAFKLAIEQTNNNQLILVCGSFHVLEAVWEYLEQCQ